MNLVTKILTKKNIQSYFLYLCIIVLICIFKSEIWSFIEIVSKDLFLAFVAIINYIGINNISFVLNFMFLCLLLMFICWFYGTYQVLRVSLYLAPLFIAILYIFGIELTIDSFNPYFLVFIIILNGLLWTYNQELK